MNVCLISVVVAFCVATCIGLAFGYVFADRIGLWRSKLMLWWMSRPFRCVKFEDLPGAWYATDCPVLWAHAGGGRLHRYGNSKEAIDDSIASGFKVIEVDVDLTSDGVPVLSHRFAPDGVVMFDSRPTVAEFLATPLNGKFTPLTLKDVFALYRDFDGWFVIDSYSLFKRAVRFDLRQYLMGIATREQLKRVIVAANSIEDVLTLHKSGMCEIFASIHYSVPDGIDTAQGIWQLPDLLRIYCGCGVRSVTIVDHPISDMTRRVVGELKRWNIRISIVGVRELDRARKWLSLGADIFNTDNPELIAIQRGNHL